MVLTILIAWLALAVLAALFLYCCSRVSNGAARELADDESSVERRAPVTTRSGRPRLGDSYGV